MQTPFFLFSFAALDFWWEHIDILLEEDMDKRTVLFDETEN